MVDLSNIPTSRLGELFLLALVLLFGVAGGVQFYTHEHAGHVVYGFWGYEVVAGLLFFLLLELRSRNK